MKGDLYTNFHIQYRGKEREKLYEEAVMWQRQYQTSTENQSWKLIC